MILIKGWHLPVKNSTSPASGPEKYVVPAGQTILAALQALGYTPKQPLLAVVNGTTADMTHLLQDGDVVQCFPQISGGC